MFGQVAVSCGRPGYLDRVDHYRTLGVAPTATRDEIRRAYLALARRYHPDRSDGDGPAATADRSARMAAVNDAWRVLGDADARADYDRQRVRSVSAPTGPPRPAPPTVAWSGDDLVPDLDEPAPDTIQGTRVQIALRVMPWVVIALVIVALFVFTAYAGPDGEPTPRPIDPGSCVLVGAGPDQLSVVACDRVNDGRVVEVLPPGRECTDPEALTIPRPGAPGTICLETTLNTRTP